MSVNEETDPTGIPTRAIHESYLNLQRALKQYRRAHDAGEKDSVDQYHGEVQDAVLTLYEMLRPHLKQNSAVTDFWTGSPPSYPSEDEATAPDPEDGTAILSWQVHPQTYTLNGTDPEEITSLREWADVLGVADSVRLEAVSVDGSRVFVRYQTYEMGLRHLDDWQTEFFEYQSEIGGFMGSKTKTDTTRKRVPFEKLERAARELANAAEKLGALSQFEASTPRTKIPDELIQEVDEWREQTLEN